MAATAIRNTLKGFSKIKSKGTRLAKESADNLSLKVTGQMRENSVKYSSKNMKNNIKESHDKLLNLKVNTSSLSPKNYMGDLAGEVRPVQQMAFESNRLHPAQMDRTYKERIRSTANNIKNTEPISDLDNIDRQIRNVQKNLGNTYEDESKRRISGARSPNITSKKDAMRNKNDKSWWDNQVDKGIPQAVGGTIGLAYLVSSMFDKRGQQSNAELYGQRTPYR